MYSWMVSAQKSQFGRIEIIFGVFEILALENVGPKMAQNPKNHEFSILNKSADSADIYDRQLR